GGCGLRHPRFLRADAVAVLRRLGHGVGLVDGGSAGSHGSVRRYRRRADRLEDGKRMKIQPSDIEAKAREIQDALDQTKESAQNMSYLAREPVLLFIS